MSDLVVPELGLEPGQSIVVSCWLARPGDRVIEGDRLVELSMTDMTFDVASPVSGRLSRICAETDESVTPGTILGRVIADCEGDDAGATA